jgi:nitroreductase
MLVCQNSDVNRKLGIINRNLFGKANSDEIRYVSKIQKSIADDDDIKSGFYNAPTVITLFAPRNWIYSAQDCSMAAESMSIAAWSIGVGSCYVSRAEKTFMSEEGKGLIAKAGINDTYEAKVCLCLGYIKGEIGQGKPRKENRILFVK